MDQLSSTEKAVIESFAKDYVKAKRESAELMRAGRVEEYAEARRRCEIFADVLADYVATKLGLQ